MSVLVQAPCKAEPCLTHIEHAHVRQRTGKKILHDILTSEPCSRPQKGRSLVTLEVPCAPPAWIGLQASIAAHKSPKARRAEFRRFLTHRRYYVPLIPSSVACGCCITGTRHGQRFATRALNRFIAALFESIPYASAAAGLPEITLSRFDLHHAHIFATESASLGLLFHAKEYPQYVEPDFPVNLGYCQINSPICYKIDSMCWRNLIW